MKINGIEILNFKINNNLYECDIALDNKYLGKFKQSNKYSDTYDFDKSILESSKNAFKQSDLYRISCFETDDDIKDFYTVDMFINDLCDLYLDEKIMINKLKEQKFKLLIIGESLITNEIVYTTINNSNEFESTVRKIKKSLNNSAIIRTYHSLSQFYFDNRKK